MQVFNNIKQYKTMRKSIEFYECEHGGDLENYLSDMRDCGATIISSYVDSEDEIGYVTYEVENSDDFIYKFINTEAYEFVN